MCAVSSPLTSRPRRKQPPGEPSSGRSGRASDQERELLRRDCGASRTAGVLRSAAAAPATMCTAHATALRGGKAVTCGLVEEACRWCSPRGASNRGNSALVSSLNSNKLWPWRPEPSLSPPNPPAESSITASHVLPSSACSCPLRSPTSLITPGGSSGLRRPRVKVVTLCPRLTASRTRCGPR